MQDCLPRRKALAPQAISVFTSSMTRLGPAPQDRLLDRLGAERAAFAARAAPAGLDLDDPVRQSRHLGDQVGALEGVRLQVLVGVENERAQLGEIVGIRQLRLGAAAELGAAGEDRPGQDLAHRERRQQLVDLVQRPRAGAQVLARRLHAHDDDQFLGVCQDLLDLLVARGCG